MGLPYPNTYSERLEVLFAPDGLAADTARQAAVLTLDEEHLSIVRKHLKPGS